MTTAAPAVEHTDRGPLTPDERAARIARVFTRRRHGGLCVS
ncbi:MULTISPECIES: hypothetical protein [Streptomyces]